MWEQYGDDHAGVCLVFDRQRLVDALDRSIGSQGSYHRGEVRYTRAGFSGSAGARLDFDEHPGESVEDAVRIHLRRHLDCFFFLKTEEWASELEYRWVMEEAATRPDAPAPAFFADVGASLRSVVLGERFPRWRVFGAWQIAQAAGVELRQMEWRSGAPVAERLRVLS